MITMNLIKILFLIFNITIYSHGSNNFTNSCFNPAIDNLGFKEIKIGTFFSEIKNNHILQPDEYSSLFDRNTCGDIILKHGILNIMDFKGDRKYEIYKIQNTPEYTLFKSTPRCIRLHFFQERLFMIEIRNAFGVIDGYSKVFNAENCINPKSYPTTMHRELKIDGNDYTLHIRENFDFRSITQTLTLIYSNSLIESSLGKVQDNTYNDY